LRRSRCIPGAPFLAIKPTEEGTGIVIVRDAAQLEELVVGNAFYQYSPLLIAPCLPGLDVGFSIFALNGELKAAVAQIRTGSTLRFLVCPQFVEAAR